MTIHLPDSTNPGQRTWLEHDPAADGALVDEAMRTGATEFARRDIVAEVQATNASG